MTGVQTCALPIWKWTFSLRFFFSMAVLFCLMAFQTVRAAEYFIPVSGFLLPFLAINIRSNWRGSVLGILAVVQLCVLVWIGKKEASFVPDGFLYETIKEAVKEIPSGEGKVFNCGWDDSPFIFYLRPDLKFVDALDPSLIFHSSPALFFGRQELFSGRITDALGLLRGSFGSDYVLCRNPHVKIGRAHV